MESVERKDADIRTDRHRGSAEVKAKQKKESEGVGREGRLQGKMARRLRQGIAEDRMGGEDTELRTLKGKDRNSYLSKERAK